MNPTLVRLKQEHHQFLRLLNCLKMEVSLLSQPDNDSGKLTIFIDAFDYISIYPERWHHPIEDEACRALLNKPLSTNEKLIVEKTEQEHLELEKLTKFMKKLFRLILQNKDIGLHYLDSVFDKYISAQIQHIQSENLHLYPLYEKKLDNQDWTKIFANVVDHQDPLFSEKTRDDYVSLYEYIVRKERQLEKKAS